MFKFNNWIKFLIEPLFSLNGCDYELTVPYNLENISASNDQTPTITGNAEYGSYVRLFSGTTQLGGAFVFNIKKGEIGDFSITSNITLPVGEHVLYAIAEKDETIGTSFSKESDRITIKITA